MSQDNMTSNNSLKVDKKTSSKSIKKHKIRRPSITPEVRRSNKTN